MARTQGVDAIAHLWAAQAQSGVWTEKQLKSCSVFFIGEKIYSYGRHYCMARLIGTTGVVVMNNNPSSPTTERHKTAVEHAVSHLKQVYCDDPTEGAGHNKKAALYAITQAIAASKRARIRPQTVAACLGTAERHAKKFNEYLAALPASERKGVRSIDPTTAALAKAAEQMKALEARQTAAQKKARAEEAKRHAELEALRRKNAVVAVEYWRCHEEMPQDMRDHGTYDTYYAPVALRLSKDKRRVETSHNAEITLRDAIKLWTLLQEHTDRGQSYSVVEGEIGVYRLNRIEVDGSVVIGCHNIAYSEIARIADQLKLEAKQPPWGGAPVEPGGSGDYKPINCSLLTAAEDIYDKAGLPIG